MRPIVLTLGLLPHPGQGGRPSPRPRGGEEAGSLGRARGREFALDGTVSIPILDFQAGDAEDFDWDLVTRQRSLQLFFEDRAELAPRALALLQNLGPRFQGERAWPTFRAQRPAHESWHWEASEVRYFTHALAQTCDGAERFREDPELLSPEGDLPTLVRIPWDGKGKKWEDRRVPSPLAPLLPRAEAIRQDARATRVKGERPRHGRWELGVFTVPVLVRKVKNFPSMFMTAFLPFSVCTKRAGLS